MCQKNKQTQDSDILCKKRRTGFSKSKNTYPATEAAAIRRGIRSGLEENGPVALRTMPPKY